MTTHANNNQNIPLIEQCRQFVIPFYKFTKTTNYSQVSSEHHMFLREIAIERGLGNKPGNAALQNAKQSALPGYKEYKAGHKGDILTYPDDFEEVTQLRLGVRWLKLEANQAKSNITRLTLELNTSKTSLISKEAHVDQLSYELANIKADKLASEARAGELEEALAASEARAGELEEAIDDRETQVIELNKTIGANITRVDKIEEALAASKVRTGELEEALAVKSALVEELEAALATARRSMFSTVQDAATAMLKQLGCSSRR